VYFSLVLVSGVRRYGVVHSEFLKYAPTLQKQLADLYQQNMPVDLSTLRRCVAAQDFSGVEYIAHKICGSAQGLFATNLAARCAELEQQASDQQSDSVALLVPQVLTQHEQFSAELNAYMTEVNLQ
jgi:HPt (histidine-containing phosphotransfer) domain-containing protein